MRKLLITFILLAILDISLLYYLNDLVLSLKTFEFKYNQKPLIYLSKPIKLNCIDDFNFNDYFVILDFNDESYKYYFDEENRNIIVKLNNYDEEYVYSYELIEPEVITKTEYITETIYVDNNENEYEEYVDYEDNHIYYSYDYYEFELGTDLSTIIQVVQDDIESYTNVTCDYSCLNPYELGEYCIYFYNDYEKVTKIVKII